MAVTPVFRRSRLERRLEVRKQQRLVLVDDYGRRGVQRLDVDDADAYRGLGDDSLQAVGQIDEFRGLPGRDLKPGVAAGGCRA